MSPDILSPRPVGEEGHLSETERLEIQVAFLTDGGSYKALAERFKTTIGTVKRCLKGPDYERVRAQYQAEVTEEVLATIRRSAVKAAELWANQAMETAAEKGDHKAAKDLLVAGKVIESGAEGPSIVVNFGIKNVIGVPEE